jgi:7-carboxy-7-deazaguanine synthase
MDLLVSELFYSIQGETTRAGFPSFFIRLAGCNLNCAWCDTAYARSGGRRMSVESVVETVTKHPASIISP